MFLGVFFVFFRGVFVFIRGKKPVEAFLNFSGEFLVFLGGKMLGHFCHILG